MSNFFDQFDEAPATPVTPAAPATGQPAIPGQVPQPDVPAPAAEPNQFDAIEAGASFPNMTEDEFNSEVYTRLRRGDSADDILAWSRQTPFAIIDNMDFRKNIMVRDEAAKKGMDEFALGRITHNKSGANVPQMGTLDSLGLMAGRAANTALFNFGDEAVAAGAALTQDGDFWDNYERNHRGIAEYEDVMVGVNPGAAYTGDAIGIGASMLAPGAIIDDIGRAAMQRAGLSAPQQLGGRMALGGAAGGTAGAVAATGEGTPDNRFENTGGGFLLGASLGTAFPLVEAGFRRVARPIMERLSPNNAKALADRTALTRDELQAMEVELQRQQELGLEPTLLDILPERARRVVGSAGRRDGARETLQDFAEERVEQLPERITRMANEEIRPTGIERSAEEVQLDLQKQRNADIEAALDPIRLTPLPIDDEIMGVLGTEAGQQAIKNIIREMPDAARRQAYTELLDQANKMARGIDPRLGEAQQQAALSQLREGTNFDLDMSERIGRELNRMADTGDGSPGLRQMGRTVRSAAEVSPAYREAMADYGAASRSVDAVTVGSGRNTMLDDNGRVQRLDNEGAGFLGEDAERFQKRFNDLLETPEMRNIDVDIPLRGSAVFDQNPYDDISVTYTSEAGNTVKATMRLQDDGKTGYVSVIGNPGNWDNARMGFKNDVKDMMRAFKREYPSVERFKGFRVTGAKAAAERRTAAEIDRARRGSRVDYDTYLDLDGYLGRAINGDQEGSDRAQALIDQMNPEQLRNLQQRLNDDMYYIQEGSPMLTMRERQIAEFERMAGDRLNMRDGPANNAPTEPFSSEQIVPAPKMVRSTTAPRVRLPTGEMAVDPADAARFEREMGAFESSRANREQRAAEMANADIYIDEDTYDNMAANLAEISSRGMSREAVSNAVERLTAPELIAFRNRFQQEVDGELNDDLKDAMQEALEIFDEVVGPLSSPTQPPSRPPPPPSPVAPPTPRPQFAAAPAERDLARLGAADQVARRAGESPEAAARVARQLVRSPNQRQRSATMLGNRAAGRLEDRARGELSRVRVAQRQATAEGPAPEGTMDGIESGVNALYNPTSPISWIRESARYLSRIGMSEDTANYIVNNAIDPNRAGEMIQLLEKQGMRHEQAVKWLDEFRDSFVKYSVLQEGNPYDRTNP